MNFNSYLKAARERCNITQSDLADKAGVSVTTIQNWENGTLPDRNYWPMIIDHLQLSRDEFIQHYTDAALPPVEKDSTQPFPDFLFPVDLIDRIKRIRLTADEQELLGLEAIYGDYEMKGDYKFTITASKGIPHLPYDYVRRLGAFHVIDLHDSLTCKIKGFEAFIVNQIKANPDKIFDIMKCSPPQLMDVCNYIKVKKGSYDYDYGYETWRDSILNIVNLLESIEKAGGSLIISVTESHSYNSYNKWNKMDIYNSYMDSYNNKVIYDKYMKLVVKECQDRDYLEVKEKYEKDRLFYKEHSSMMDHSPVEPEFKGTRNMEMTEDGKKLLAWYKANFSQE